MCIRDRFKTYLKSNGAIKPFGPKVNEVQVKGNMATVKAAGHEGVQRTLLMKEDGGWKVLTWSR